MADALIDELSGHKLRAKTDKRCCTTEKAEGEVGSLSHPFTDQGAGGDDGYIVINITGWLRPLNRALGVES